MLKREMEEQSDLYKKSTKECTIYSNRIVLNTIIDDTIMITTRQCRNVTLHRSSTATDWSAERLTITAAAIRRTRLIDEQTALNNERVRTTIGIVDLLIFKYERRHFAPLPAVVRLCLSRVRSVSLSIVCLSSIWLTFLLSFKRLGLS